MTIKTIHVDDVNKALALTLGALREGGQPVTAASVANQRPTIEWPGVFVTEYSRPNRNVLFDPVRDANPFFHYLEAMWILAGRRDVEFLQTLLPRMADYSDDGLIFHGAYGHRLRQWPVAAHDAMTTVMDQVTFAIDKLRKDPSSRQVVMSIWNPEQDLGAVTRDMPCNDMIMVKVRDGALNLTVNNRSNDAVLGAYGANVVQFSMLQMYMAAMIGVKVGRYTQVSDSMHVYEDNPYWQKFNAGSLRNYMDYYAELGDANLFEHNIGFFDLDLHSFFRVWQKTLPGESLECETEYALTSQAVLDCYTIYNTLLLYRKQEYKLALEMADRICASDWRLACCQWINRRIVAKELKATTT